MNIALTAATGKIGTATVAAAASKNLSIRALVRDPKRIQTPAMRFDFADRTTFAPALDGVQTLILVSPASPRQSEHDSAVVDAARTAGVAHVIKISGAGADEAGTRFGAQHRAVEAHIRASGLRWTFVRPTFFMENMLGIAAPISAGRYPAPTADARMTQIAVADIAAVLVAIAADPARHHGATYTLTGPTADRGSDIAAALSTAIGLRVEHVDVPEDAFRQKLLEAGLDEWTADGVLEGFRKVRAGGAAEVTDDVRRVTGRAPITFSAWAAEHFQKAVPNA